MDETYVVELTAAELKALREQYADAGMVPAALQNLSGKLRNAKPPQAGALERLEEWRNRNDKRRTYELGINGLNEPLCSLIIDDVRRYVHYADTPEAAILAALAAAGEE